MLKRIIVTAFIAFLSFPAFTQTNEAKLAQALGEFNRGSYARAISLLESVDTSNTNLLASKFYLLGISHARLQQFTRAANALAQAQKHHNKTDDLYYELGQALYASNKLEEAREAFDQSFKKNYMTATSLYYMAHISQILYEHPKAIEYYQQLLTLPEADQNMRQIARFQKAEVTLLQAEELSERDQRNLVSNQVLPEFHLALEEISETAAASDIQRRILEVQDKFGLNPNKMVNGRMISPKRLTLNFSQKLRYDNNITLANDQPTVVSTLKDSFISDSTFFASYHSTFLRRFSLIPELRIQNLYHHDRSTKEIYMNDRYTLSPGVRGHIEHTLFGQMAAVLIQLNYDHTSQDKTAQKELGFFARSWTFGLGERIKIFPFGETTFRYKYKTYRAHSLALDNDTHTLSLDQVVILPNGHLAIFMLQYDDLDNFNNTNNSTASTMARVDYIMTNFFPRTNLHFALSYTALDTKEQASTRGTESSWNPSIKMTKRLTETLRISFDYNYTTKTSQDITKEYSKHATTFELRYDY